MRTIRMEREGALARLVFDRPDKLNALNENVLRELDGVLSELEEDRSVRVVVLHGEGRAFVAGADIGAMAEMGADQAVRFARLGQRVFDHLEALPQVTIAAVHGFALGGGMELAMACDIRVVERSARLGQPEVRLGLIPGFAGTQRLSRLVGTGWARYLILTGIQITGEEAHRIGLAEVLAEDGQALETARKVAAEVLNAGPTAVALAKRVILRGRDMPFAVAEAYEAESFAYLFTTGEPREGLRAFLEKRKASWMQEEA